jgi:uncharacterized surface protein with fasciclin (FAS1) repeats
MKNHNTYKGLLNSTFILLLVSFVTMNSLNSCQSDPILPAIASSKLVISDYISENNSLYSEFDTLLKVTELNSLLSIRGPFTLLLPTDSAMKVYCASKNVATVLDFDLEFQKQIVLNHLIPASVSSGDIGEGAISTENALGVKISTEFKDADIYFNKTSKLKKYDIKAANGYIHVIDKVLDIVTMSVYEKVASLPQFSIFAKGLEAAGLNDTLSKSSIPFGTRMAPTKFTLLAVSDSLYNANGIYTLQDLINRYTDKPSEIENLENGFYRYMEYHCLTGAYFFSDFSKNEGKPKLYPILSFDNNVSITIGQDYVINPDTTKEYTTFIREDSNHPAKNGAVHSMTTLLEVVVPEPAILVWEPTATFDLMQGDYYGKYYQRWFDGQNTFEKIKWEGDYLLYYYKNHDTGKLLNDDCLSMYGYWWVEVTTPKIMKGKYKMTGNIWGSQTDYEVYVDGKLTATVLSTDPAESTTMAEVVWDTTSEHKVKIVTLSFGMLFFDTLIFTPMN